ncbi:MAG: S-methyl-5'-thioadenosine phosphorylase [Candidatus Hadarchaeales archaeon]
MAKIGIIGGSGFYSFRVGCPRILQVLTPYGKVEVEEGVISGKEVVFLARHGRWHNLPPHLVNYRANLWALKRRGVERIIGLGACGSLDPKIKPGELVLLDQFLDFTKQRACTFFEGGRRGVAHVDMTNPYCPELGRVLSRVARGLGVRLHKGVTYVCTEGPRFETPAEIRMFRMLGGQVVGMTGVPECVLARELELCYAGVGIVTNLAAGLSGRKLTHREVIEKISGLKEKLTELLSLAVKQIPDRRNCECGKALVDGLATRKAPRSTQ